MNSISKNFIAGPAVPEPSGTSVEFVLAGLDSLNQGITIFDAELRLVATNRLFLEMRDIPEQEDSLFGNSDKKKSKKKTKKKVKKKTTKKRGKK